MTRQSRSKSQLRLRRGGLARRPDPDQAQQLDDLLPLLDIDAAILAEASFRELLPALDVLFFLSSPWVPFRGPIAPRGLRTWGDETADSRDRSGTGAREPAVRARLSPPTGRWLGT